MSTSSLQIAALLLASAATLSAQISTPATPKQVPAKPNSSTPATPKSAPKSATPYINHNLIFLDPAHGGSDPGAHLANQILEKDVTLALASRIRTRLTGNNISVLLAREADIPTAVPDPDADADATAAAPQSPTPDQRAGAANHAHPVACILLHATSSGNGVHIVTSALTPVEPDPTAPPARVTSWDSAQTDSIPQSLRLASEIATAVARANLPVHLSHASVKPIDSLTCPAVAIEIAPLLSGPTQVSDTAYQQRVAEAVATALLFWRGHADPPAAPSPPGAQP